MEGEMLVWARTGSREPSRTETGAGPVLGREKEASAEGGVRAETETGPREPLRAETEPDL